MMTMMMMMTMIDDDAPAEMQSRVVSLQGLHHFCVHHSTDHPFDIYVPCHAIHAMPH